MHVNVYLLSDWSRDAEGNVSQFTLDAIANGWESRIEDVTDQPGNEIRLGHRVVLEVACEPETLAEILKTGRYTVLEKAGVLTANEKTEVSRHADELQLLPAHATREMAKQVLVERFREQGLRDDLRQAVKESVKDVLRETTSHSPATEGNPRPW